MFKFEQNLNLTFNIGLNFQKSDTTTGGSKVDTTTFSTSLSGNYNVLQNLKTTAALAYSMIKDNVNRLNSCQIITISLGGDLEF